MMPALVVAEPVGLDVHTLLPLSSPDAEYLPAAQSEQSERAVLVASLPS